MKLNLLRGVTSIFLITLIITGYSFTSMMPEVLAQLNFSISPSSQTTQPGGTAQYTVTLSTPPGTKWLDPVQLLVSPTEPGITISFSINNQAPSFTSIMAVHVNPSKPTGTYTINVWAHPQGKPFPGPDSKQLIVKLDVVTPVPMPTAPFFDFNIEVSPPLIEVGQGDPAHYQIHISYSDPAFSGTAINIQVTGLGPDINWHSTPSGDLTITTSPTTPPGDYPVEVTGSAQGIVHHATATLIVGEHPPEEPPFEEPPPEEPPPEELPPEEPPPEEPLPEEKPSEEPDVPKEAPSIMLSTEVGGEGEIIVHGVISPPLYEASARDEPAFIDITYTGPNSEMITHTVLIMGYDVFEDHFQSPTHGTWTIVADWRGNEYPPASSQPATVTIEPEGFPIFMDPLIWIIIILAGIVVALTIAFRRRKREPTPKQPQKADKYCASCGAPIKPGKDFCNSCGEQAE